MWQMFLREYNGFDCVHSQHTSDMNFKLSSFSREDKAKNWAYSATNKEDLFDTEKFDFELESLNFELEPITTAP